MQIIWYENKALVFKSGDAETDIPCVRGGTGSDLSPANLLQKFDNNNILYVLSENPDTPSKLSSATRPSWRPPAESSKTAPGASS